MYKLIYSCSEKTTVTSKDLRKLYKIAKALWIERDGNHYKLKLYNPKGKIIKDWSCACYRGLSTELPSFKFN